MEIEHLLFFLTFQFCREEGTFIANSFFDLQHPLNCHKISAYHQIKSEVYEFLRRFAHLLVMETVDLIS